MSKLPKVSAALEALGAEELRAFVLDMLASLDEAPRARIVDALVRRAASSSSWRPGAPRAEVVDQVQGFVASSRRTGRAEPERVDEILRKGVEASLASDHQAARAILGAMLVPLAKSEFDLGQEEMIEEVLSIDLEDCVARYVAAVYITTPLPERAGELLGAMDSVGELAYWTVPIASMERVIPGPLPDLDAFLPSWITRLEAEAKGPDSRESEGDRWLREAVTRKEGTPGLERIARTTKHPEAVQAWCNAVMAEGDWARSLRVHEDAATLVPDRMWHGGFLDGAALSAQLLGRKDLVKKLEAAWLGAPTLARLLRWLLAGEPSAAALRKRAAGALRTCPTKSSRIVGVLHVIVGDIQEAASLLEKAPGLGWSSGSHPGHILFPTFAWLLGGSPAGSAREQLTRGILGPTDTEMDFGLGYLDGQSFIKKGGKDWPELDRPRIVSALQQAGVTLELATADGASALSAMRAAAAHRVEAAAFGKRRSCYQHAALLVACCVELEGNNSLASSAWARALQQRTARFPAFRRALTEQARLILPALSL